MRMFLILIFCLMGSAVNASPRSGDALKTELKDNQFHATLKEGFHFNEKAPNAVIVDSKTIQPAKITGREMGFTTLPKEWAAGHAALYVCDDALTYCETRSVNLRGGDGEALAKSSTKKLLGKINRYGFIEDDYQKAVAQAQKEGKLLLIDFSARWCPGCVRLEKEVFGLKDFKALTKDIVKLKLDVDRFENSVLAEKYKVKGIPTLLVVTTAQEEIDRIVDFQSLEVLQGFFNGVKADPLSLTELKVKAESKDPTTVLRLGKRLLSAGRAREALPYLEQVKPPPFELLKAKVAAAEAEFNADKNLKAKYLDTLKAAISAEPGSVRSLEWRSELVGLLDDKAEAKKVADEGVALADSLLADRKKMNEAMKSELAGEFTGGFEGLYVAMVRAGMIESSGAAPEVVKAAWQRAGKAGKDVKIPLNKEGANLRHLIVLIKAEMYKEADRLVLAMMKVNPGNAELQRRRMKIMVEQKKFEEVILIGQVAIKNSYGRNEFWVAEMMAKAYVGLKRKKEASQFIDRYLARQEIGWTQMASAKKTLEELKLQVNQ